MSTGQITLTRQTRIAAQVSHHRTNDEGKTLHVMITDSSEEEVFSADVTLTAATRENLTLTTIGTTVVTDDTLPPGEYTVEAVIGESQDPLALALYPGQEDTAETVAQLGAGAHSEPRALLLPDNYVVQSFVESLCSRIFAALNNAGSWELFGDIPSEDIDYPDNWHRTCVFAWVNNGLLALTSSHHKPIWGRWVEWQGSAAATLDTLAAATSFRVRNAGFTYLHARPSLDGKSVHILSRRQGSGMEYATLLTLTDLTTGGGTVTEEIVAGVGADADNPEDGRWYPRGLAVLEADDGSEVLAIGAQHRVGAVWGSLHAFVRHAGTWYNLAGDVVGTGSGTTGSPRIGAAQLQAALGDGGTVLVESPASGVRYSGSAFAFRAIEWSMSKAIECAGYYADGDVGTGLDGYTASGLADFRLFVARGSAVSLTSAKASAPAPISGTGGIGAGVTYRVPGTIWYDGETLHYAIVQPATNAAAINGATDYHRWGGVGDSNGECAVRRMAVDLSGDLPADLDDFTDLGDVAVAVAQNRWLVDLGEVWGLAGAWVAHVGVVNDLTADYYGAQRFYGTGLPEPGYPVPDLSAPGVSEIVAAGCTLTVTTDTGEGTAYVVVVPLPDTDPDADDVIAGTDADGGDAVFAGEAEVSEAGEVTFAATGLTAGIVYRAFFTHEAGGDPAAVVATAPFTPVGAVAAGGFVYYGG